MNSQVNALGASGERPFPGLRPFAYQDHGYFFGREDHIYALYRLIDRSRFIAVVGSSGSGKSSLVRAGLLPLLDAETRETAGRSWLWREMRPGDAPLQRLTELLSSLAKDDDRIVASGRRERIAAQLQRSSFGISEALAEMNGVAGQTLVLVIDQFEELFRYAAAGSAKTGSSGDEVRARDEATQFVQLLLEASRAPSSQIHVMLTMRSDFIGDCARFHGLPEAVCAAQFLVPSLTRDQLDEVIRMPVKEAGATIDPELVERLLNDCGTEMDQLPVLQHCLSRLWEEAGKAPAATAMPPDARAEQQTGIGQDARRHLSLNHYRNIGEFADALSRHADEILKDLPGPTLQLAVEQIFSALSEQDKEGRAIRRSLRFSQLVAETGVDEATVRQVLDRFRAYDCSFLITSPSDVKEIGATTRIDVGHEALLRRWDKVSGRGAELGWLRAEQQAGERYRGLLAMAEGDRAKIPSHLIDERWAWWKARPRTEQWAERYGGGFARVQRLLQASQAGQRIKRWGIAAAFAVVAATAVTMFALWQAAEHARTEANTTRITALTAIKTSIERLKGFLDDGTLRAAGAQLFLKDADETLQSSKTGQSAEMSGIEISLLLAVSEVKGNLGDDRVADELAAKAETLSEYIVKKYPNQPSLKHKLYASKFRVADQLAKNLEDNAAKAEEKYRAAFTIAQQLAASEPGNTEFQRDIASSGNKIGDIEQYRRNWQAAMDQYGAGLKIHEAVNEKFPSPAARREIATQKARIAQVLSQRKEPGDDLEALRQHRGVLAIQEELLKDDPANPTLLSNVALTYQRIAVLLKDKPREALRHYEAAVANSKQLYESDPGNLTWRTGLARDQTSLGDVLMQLKEWREASRNYGSAARIAEGILLKNRNDTVWQAALAELNVKRGDAQRHRGDEDPSRFNDALAYYRTAARSFEDLANNPKVGPLRYRELFDVRIKIGDILRRQNKHKEALDAYQSASAMAERVATSHGIVDWQIELSVAIEEAGDTLRSPSACCQLASNEDALAYYQKALEVIEPATIKEPDNQNLQSRKSAITAKIEPLVTNRETRAQ
jgi:tetratricopeptide (TPR) repeat protein